MKLKDRKNAGILLAQKLTAYKNKPNVVVLALPRGGVPVAFEIANALSLPLDLLIVRKLGVPIHPELAFGAVSHHQVTVFNQQVIKELHITQEMIEKVIAKESEELKRREKVYRHNQPFPDLKNKVVILVDDGIATGATMRAAILLLRKMHVEAIVVAVPVASSRTVSDMREEVDELICLLAPDEFNAVGEWYEDFSETKDAEVESLLQKMRQH